MNNTEDDAIDRLKFFCSNVMSGDDWLSSEPYFLAVERQRDGLLALLRRAKESIERDGLRIEIEEAIASVNGG